MTTTINAPTWPEAGHMIAALIRNGTPEGREIAAKEVLRMAGILQQFTQQGEDEEEALTPEQLRFVTPDVPEGWDTVLGYTAKHAPEALVYDAWDPVLTQRDGFWLVRRMREEDEEPIKVPAPEVLQEQGIMEVNAYPEGLLRRRILGASG